MSELERLLVTWRATHDPALEPQIARAGIAAARERDALTAKTKADLEKAWRAVAAKRDPADLDRLLDAPWPRTWKDAQPRVKALARFAPDPRMHKLASVATAFTSLGSAALHQDIAAVLVASPTAASLPGLDAIKIFRGLESEIYGEARAAIATLGPQPAPSTDDTAPRSERDARALFAEHVQRPGDIGLRSVLADALQRERDPRGEFIALQLAIADGRADAKARARASALLAAHGDGWTGPLPGIVRGSVRFERGFLVALRSTAAPEALAAASARPEWRTVEELVLSHGPSSALPLLPQMPLLRRLWQRSDEGLAAIAAAGTYPSIEVIACALPHGRADCAWLAFPRAAFPNLRVFLRMCPREWSAEIFGHHQTRARSLGLHAAVHLAFPHVHLADAVRLRAAGPPETRFTLDVHPDSFDGDGWRVRVFRDADRAVLAWGGGRADQLGDATSIVEALFAAGITEIAVHVPNKAKGVVSAALGDRAGVHFDGAPIDLVASP